MADSSTVSDRILKLGFEVDKQSTEVVKKQIDSLEKSLIAVGKQERALAGINAEVARSYGNMTAKAVESRNEFLKGTKAARDQITVLDRLKQKQGEVSKPGTGGGGINAAVPGLASAVGGSLNAAGLGELGGAATGAGQVINAFKQLQMVAGPAAEGTAAATGSLSSLAVAGPLAAAALIAMAIAVKGFVDKVDAGKKMVAGAIDAQRTYYELTATGTSETIKLGLQELEVKKQVEAATRRDLQAQIEINKQRFGIFGGLANDFIGLTQEAKESDEALQGLEFSVDAYTRALSSNEVKARDTAEAQKELAEASAESADEAAKRALNLNTEIAKLNEDGAKQEIAIREKAAEQIDQIIKRSAQAEVDALKNLERDKVEAGIKASQQEQDTLLAFQRDEVKSSREHGRKLNEIRRDAQREEADLIRDRDFAGLARLRRDTDQKLDDAEDQFSNERSDRLEALRQKISDDKTGFIREREARLRAYSQQLTDLRTARKREIDAAKASRDSDLEKLRASLKAEREIKQAAYDEAFKQAKAFFDRMRGLSSSSPPPSTPPTTAPPPTTGGGGSGQGPQSGLPKLAGGGFLRPGQTAEVNEGWPGQQESFNGIRLPRGRGFFTPAEPGRVSPGAPASMSLSSTIIIQESRNLKATQRMVESALEKFATKVAG